MPGTGFRTGTTFRINGRNYIALNASLASAPPAPSNVFISPSVRNDLVKDLGTEKRKSGEISYHHNAPALRYRLTLFVTGINDQVSLKTYWHDTYNTTVNQVIKNMRTVHQGIEASIEKNFSGRHTFQGAFGFAQALFKGQPTPEAWRDNDNTKLLENETCYLNNYRCNSSPQLATGISYRYSAKKYWYVSAACNYWDELLRG